MANAILTSAFNIGFANALDKIVTPPINSQAAATNTAAATNMQAAAQGQYTGVPTSVAAENLEISNICSAVQNAIPDKTSTAYTSVVQACITANNQIGSTLGQRVATLMSAINGAATGLVSAAATSVTPTQAQAASKQAFTDVTNTVKDMMSQQKFQPTITMDQGTPIRIYVNKDYKFPKAVLQKSRLMK